LQLITFKETHTHTHRVSRAPLDEGSARRTNLYLITHNIHKRQTSMLPAGFEPAIPRKRAAADIRPRSRSHSVLEKPLFGEPLMFSLTPPPSQL